MKSRIFINVLSLIILLSATLGSCTSAPTMPIQLASFTENDVSVSIALEHPSAENYFLSATFTPPDGYHLYSKDMPVHGINGLGRPTLFELTANSHIRASGELIESVSAQQLYFEPQELPVYPLGGVTLSLPVELPPGKNWVNDELKITFMACSSNQCKPPVEGKIISIRVPGAYLFENQ
ncbi:MAG TPA: hypothetical protein VF918_14275 [Anaerolineales bacterium]